MEWDPLLNSLVNVENAEYREYLRHLNHQIDQHINEEVNYEQYLNTLLREHDNYETKLQLEKLNSEIELYEIFDDDDSMVATTFRQLDEIPTHITLNVQSILEFRRKNNLLSNYLKNDDNAYVSFILNIANIIHHINSTKTKN